MNIVLVIVSIVSICKISLKLYIEPILMSSHPKIESYKLLPRRPWDPGWGKAPDLASRSRTARWESAH